MTEEANVPRAKQGVQQTSVTGVLQRTPDWERSTEDSRRWRHNAGHGLTHTVPSLSLAKEDLALHTHGSQSFT